jgi:hypothetical protein
MEITNIDKSKKIEKYSAASFKFSNEKTARKTLKKEHGANEQKRRRAYFG